MREFVRSLNEEDGVIEWLTALGFLGACALALLLAWELRRGREHWLAALYVGLAAGMLLAMLEEISWGQRIFDLETPQFFVENSTKPEINIHNLKAFPLGLAFIVVGFYGAFSRLLTPRLIQRRFPLWVEMLTPSRRLAPFFLLTFVVYGYYEYIYYAYMRPMGITVRREYSWEGHLITGKMQEPVELVLAVGFLLFVYVNWRSYRRTRLAG